MMYMSDAVKATIDLMNAPEKNISIRTSYNIAAISFSPEEIADAIRKNIPGFEITYTPDHRQKIADSWPNSIDDSAARSDWNWKPEYDLNSMTEDILKYLPWFLGCGNGLTINYIWLLQKGRSLFSNTRNATLTLISHQEIWLWAIPTAVGRKWCRKCT
jgi:hypothetical protein